MQMALLASGSLNYKWETDYSQERHSFFMSTMQETEKIAPNKCKSIYYSIRFARWCEGFQ